LYFKWLYLYVNGVNEYVNLLNRELQPVPCDAWAAECSVAVFIDQSRAEFEQTHKCLDDKLVGK